MPRCAKRKALVGPLFQGVACLYGGQDGDDMRTAKAWACAKKGEINMSLGDYCNRHRNPKNHFRIGFGRNGMDKSLNAMRNWLMKNQA